MIRKRLSACLVAICLAALSLDAVAYQPPAPYPPPEATTVLRGLGLIERHNLAWSADSSELLITLSTSFVASRDELPGINLPSAVTTFDLNHAAFIYNLDSGQTRLVQPSPFSLRLTDQEREHYQSGDNPVYTSPHVDSEITPVNIVYASTLGSYCGVECSNRIPMLGEYWPQDLDRGTYAPLDMRVSASGLRVIWSATSAFAVVESIADFGSFATIYHLDLGTGETEYVDLIDVTLDDVFAVSNDGRRILYSRTDFAEGLHRAITW